MTRNSFLLFNIIHIYNYIYIYIYIFFQLPAEKGTELRVEVTGKGTGNMRIDLRYNVEKTDVEKCPFDIEVTSNLIELDTPSINIGKFKYEIKKFKYEIKKFKYEIKKEFPVVATNKVCSKHKKNDPPGTGLIGTKKLSSKLNWKLPII